MKTEIKKKKKKIGMVDLKHKLLLKEMSKNVSKGMAIGEAFTEAGKALGYSESYLNTGRLKETASFQEALNTAFPTEYIIKHHTQLMEAVEIEHYVFPAKMKDEKITEVINSFGFPVMKIETNQNWKRAFFPVINARAKKDALDMIYKLKKLYDNTIPIKFGVESIPDEDLERELAGIIQRVSTGLAALKGKTKKKG